MKITGQGNTIIVETRGKKIIIKGELTTTPIFYADTASMTHWAPPHDTIEIFEKEKLDIIQQGI